MLGQYAHLEYDSPECIPSAEFDLILSGEPVDSKQRKSGAQLQDEAADEPPVEQVLGASQQSDAVASETKAISDSSTEDFSRDVPIVAKPDKVQLASGAEISESP
ncbi:hypothetical protein FVE85_9688 [Porphyridium purpureum]|uniref:Uncharacterized protein n=1 Tax=Porphyridium purpureum TaxID=35688 RepID=A0A5J4YJL8_PORPP|nr:hypothetical protein FVE85_9688 [Porphyridium purpureum]|eukprot:POR8558..scf246_12